MEKGKEKNGFQLMGFGHRVYKNYDPRAQIIKNACDKLLGKLGISDPLLDIAKELEEATLNDSYYVEGKALSECRFLQWDNPESGRHTLEYVYGDV